MANAEQQLPAGVPVFVNVEPSTLNSALIERTAPIATAGQRTVVLEVTERAIATAPAELLAGVVAAREHGWLIALDDVGVDPGSLAFLPIIQPDVVKLDMGLIQDRPDRELGRTMTAVMAHAERTGAALLAEGIESPQHLDRAVSLGATLGQGYHFGRPSEHVDRTAARSAFEVPRTGVNRSVALSPYDAVAAAGHRVRVARKDVLLQISHQIEEQGMADPCAPLVLGAFQEAHRFTPATAVRYSRLARTCGLVAALGVSMDPEPAHGVRGAAILPGDPLEAEWSVIVLGPHYAGAL